MVGWNHQLNGQEFEQTLGYREGQGSLACCSPWGYNWTTTKYLTPTRNLVYITHTLNFWNGFRRIGINSSLDVYSICLWSHLSWTFVFCSVPKSCPTLWDPMDRSTPGFPVFHYLPEIAQTHVHWVDDAIQSSHPLSPASFPALNVSQHQSLFFSF